MKDLFKLVKPIFNFIKKRYEGIVKFVTGYDFQGKHALYGLFWLTLLPIIALNWQGFVLTWIVILALSPIYVPIIIVNKLWDLWMEYINLKFLAQPAQKPQLYELKIPTNVEKSPAAMELVLANLLLSQGTTTEINRNWEGKVRPWWSLEITGINGEVKMYIWMWERFREHVEAQLYAQFPEVQMIPVDDYTANVTYDPEKQFMFAHRFKLKGEEALPIKTYYDYGLHEHSDKWEVKIDPMVNILEKFALAKQGEQIWMQILIQKSDRDVAKEAEEMIAKIYKDKSPEYPDPNNPEEKLQGMAMLTPMEREKVEAINRASRKPVFDVVIRNLYLADKEHMNTLRIQSLGKMFQAYDGFNALAAFEGKAPKGDYPWAKYTLPNKDAILKKFLAAYKLRSAFHHPYARPSITLSVEELATLFHFPSQEAEVPGLDKAQAKASAPPVNLPIG